MHLCGDMNVIVISILSIFISHHHREMKRHRMNLIELKKKKNCRERNQIEQTIEME